MTEAEIQTEIQRVLVELEDISYVAHRDTREALPYIEPYGPEVSLLWMRTCKDLFEHDRDAGKPFIRGSRAAAEVSGQVLSWTEQARKFLVWRGSWRALEAFMQNLVPAWRLLGAEGEARWAALGLDWCGRHLESGTAYFRVPVAELAGARGAAGIEALLAPADELFNNRRLGLATYLAGAVRVRDMLGADAILPWAKRGADILQSGRSRGEAYFRLESEESIGMLLENLPGFRLPEHQRLFKLLLHVWFDQDFDLAEGKWAPDQGRAFIETDGRELFLPPALATREEALLALLHTAGHLMFDSYERRHIEALFREVGSSHPPLDAEQRITWRPLFARYGEDMIRFQLIFDICEDLRVDWCIGQRVPNHLARLRRAAEANPPPPGAAGDYYRYALDTLRALTGGAALDERLRPLLAPDATIVDAFRIANALYAEPMLPAIALAERQAAFLPGRSPNAARPVYPRDRLDQAERGTGATDTEDKLKNSEIRPNPEQREVPRIAQGDDPDFDIPPEETSGSGGRVGVGIPQPAHVVGYARGAGLSENGQPYPEWDYRDNRYKRRWAWVQERRLDEADAGAANKLLEQYSATLKRLKRAIQSQKPARMAPRRRQFEGEELDMDAAINYVAEKRAGMSPQPAIYRQRMLQQRDTAVMLLADLSTSIMQQDPDGDARVVDRIRAGMLLFAEAMEEIGDPYAIAGFASKYRDSVSFYDIKGFDQRLSAEVRAVLGGLTGRLATRMGAAIRHAVRRFDEAPSRRRLLLILSDGRPADYDDGGDVRYLHEDTRMAVKEAVDSGVHPFCVTVDRAGSEYLPQIFGPGHYLVLDHVGDLPNKLAEIYLRLKR